MTVLLKFCSVGLLYLWPTLQENKVFNIEITTLTSWSWWCWLLTYYFSSIPYPWFSFALLLIEPTQSTTHGWVSTKTSRNSLKSLKRIFFQPIWLKGLSIGILRSPVMSAIPRSPFQTLLLTFILNYLTLALFLLSRKKGFANLLSVIVTTSM